MNKQISQEITNSIEINEYTSNYNLNLLHNAGRYKYINIIKTNYKGITYYSFDMNKWYKTLGSCKQAITKIYG